MLLKHSLKALILRELTTTDQMSFTELQNELKATPGNLGKSIERLLAARYITKVPNSERISIYRVTGKGNSAYTTYVCELSTRYKT